jgi:hypothetical protein
MATTRMMFSATERTEPMYRMTVGSTFCRSSAHDEVQAMPISQRRR